MASKKLAPDTPINNPRVYEWALKPCDTLKVCIYRLETYISPERSVIFCLDKDTSSVDSMNLYNRKTCQIEKTYNSSILKFLTLYLTSIFDDERKAAMKTTLKPCSNENIENDYKTLESCLDAIKYTSHIGLPGNVTLNSQEAYRLKIYMVAMT